MKPKTWNFWVIARKGTNEVLFLGEDNRSEDYDVLHDLISDGLAPMIWARKGDARQDVRCSDERDDLEVRRMIVTLE